MSDESTPAAANGTRTWTWWIGRMVVVYVVLPYVGLCLLLTLFQRSIMYVPMRSDGPIEPDPRNVAAAPTETIEVTTDDGLVLRGWHATWQGGTDHADRRLVLYFPGNAGNRSHRAGSCAELAMLGFDVYLVDYRGYGDNPGSPSQSRLVADAHAVWRHATEKAGFQPDRVFLHGESLGGGVAVQLAGDICDAGTPPGGVFTLATFSSMTDTAGSHYPFLPVSLVLWDRYQSARRIPDVTCPILMVHGEDDRIVPIRLGRKLFDVAPQRSAGGVEKRFVGYPNRGHNDLTPSEFATAVTDWLDAIEGASGGRSHGPAKTH